MIDAEYIQSLSDYLFWDTDKGSIDLESNAPFVVKRVLEFGQIKDWNLIVKRYGMPHITNIVKNLRTLDPKAVSFVSAISSIPEETFRCYTTKQSPQTHWDS